MMCVKNSSLGCSWFSALDFVSAYMLWEFVLIITLHVTLYPLHYINNLQRPFFPKEQLEPQQGVRGVFECVDLLHVWCGGICINSNPCCCFGFFHHGCSRALMWTVFCKCVFTQVCVTDQRAEPLGWVSTGDARRVHSDLHHLFHVGRWRLTCVELPSWPSFRVPQTLAHIKLTLSQQRQEEQYCSNAGGLDSHTGQTGRR